MQYFIIQSTEILYLMQISVLDDKFQAADAALSILGVCFQSHII